MISLRQKQNQEVLNEDLNANRRVLDRAKQRVAGLEENVVPRKQVDAQVEVGVTQGIMALNSILEQKIIALEKALSGKSRFFPEVEASGSFVNAYNSIVALYNKSGLARDAQDLLKVRFQDLQTNLDAVVYGYDQLIDNMFSEDEVTKSLMNVIRASCAYREVQEQVFESGTSMNFRPLTQADIETKLKAVVGDFSTDRQELLKQSQLGARMGITQLPYRNFPLIGDTIKDRIEEIEAERGFTLPESVKANLYKLAGPEVQAETTRLFSKFKDFRELEGQYAETDGVLNSLIQQIHELEEKYEELQTSKEEMDADFDSVYNLYLEEEGKDAALDAREFVAERDPDALKMNDDIVESMESIQQRIEDLNTEKDRLVVQQRSLGEAIKNGRNAFFGVEQDMGEEKAEASSASAVDFTSYTGKRTKKGDPHKGTAEYRAFVQAAPSPSVARSPSAAPSPSVASSPSEPRGRSRNPRSDVRASYDARSPSFLSPAPLDADGKPRKHHAFRGLASMKSRYHEDSSSESESESDEDAPRRRNPHRAMFSYDHRDNDMYC